jgi:hypothetical protein
LLCISFLMVMDLGITILLNLRSGSAFLMSLSQC